MQKHLMLTAASCLALGVLCGFFMQPFNSQQDIQAQYWKFANALNYIVQGHVDSVDANKLTEAAIKGMVEAINDPYAEYFPPKQKEAFEENFRGNFQGIGIRFGVKADTITVVVPIIGGPSDAAGLQFGDKIVKINGINAVGMKQDSVPLKLKGPAGTQVTITIKRGNEPLRDITITRGVVPTYSVEGAYMLDNSDIGYIFINRFAATTVNELVEAVKKLKQQGMKKLVLDLRNNPGGYLDQAWRMADEFIKGGQRLVYTKDRNDQIREAYMSNPGGALEDLPVVVLINGGSASASEIVSGAIQDLDRGLVVGETSFGKGLVQQVFPLNDGSGVKFTTARYYTPSGRLIQRPYKDKQKYLAMEGRNTLAEGANLDHKSEADSNRPAFKTLSGRTVLGGGGIVPDYIIKSDTVTKFYRQLAEKGVFAEASEKYVMAHATALRAKYNRDFRTFWKQYTVSEEYMKLFKESAEQKKMDWNDAEFKTDEQTIKLAMKALVASYIWNWNDGAFIGALMQPKQLEKALTLFPEAMKIAKAK
jgi:carboxyl-terminal processing protease